jgi:hypothetical protein
MTDPRTEVRDARHIAALWTGVLLAPTAFLANLELAYLAVGRACLRDNTLPVHLVHATFLLVALGGVVVAWRLWRAEGREWPGDEGGPVARTRFLAGVGLVGSVLFTLVIIAQWIPTLTLHPCQ